VARSGVGFSMSEEEVRVMKTLIEDLRLLRSSVNVLIKVVENLNETMTEASKRGGN